MNNTNINLTTNEPDWIAISGWALFVISELMPFLKKKENFNGFIHTVICLLNGSKCLAEKALLDIENPEIGGNIHK